MITPSTAIVSPGRTRMISPAFICSAGIIFSSPFIITLAVCGVKRTSFSIPALALATVRSSSKEPSCIIKATSPAAKSSPINTEAIRARDTSTSALISKEVIRPIMASKIIGTPQRIIATHAASTGNGTKSKTLIISESPPSTRNTMSFFFLQAP